MKIARLLFPLLLLLASLTGCASVSLVDSWKTPVVPKNSYRNFLVVGITQDLQMRMVFEEVLAAELRQKGLTAIPSYTVTGAETKLSREIVVKAVQSTSVDAVITTRVIDRNKKSHTAVGYEMTSRGVSGYADWYGSGMVSYATFDMKPVEVTTSSTYALETHLFDTATQNLVWAGTTNAVDPKGLITVSRLYAGVVIKSLNKEGMIQ